MGDYNYCVRGRSNGTCRRFVQPKPVLIVRRPTRRDRELGNVTLLQQFKTIHQYNCSIHPIPPPSVGLLSLLRLLHISSLAHGGDSFAASPLVDHQRRRMQRRAGHVNFQEVLWEAFSPWPSSTTKTPAFVVVLSILVVVIVFCLTLMFNAMFATP